MTRMMPRQFQVSRKRAPTQQRHGWTLVELMVVMALCTIVLAALVPTITFVSESFIATGNYSDLDRTSRIALDTLSRDIRNAAAVSSYATNSITLSNQDGTQITYAWNPSTGNFARSDNAGTRVLLTHCDTLNFFPYQRNPTNSFEFTPTTTVAQIKLIDVSWRCSRHILGTIVNSESVQTAEIVIRN